MTNDERFEPFQSTRTENGVGDPTKECMFIFVTGVSSIRKESRYTPVKRFSGSVGCLKTSEYPSLLRAFVRGP